MEAIPSKTVDGILEQIKTRLSVSGKSFTDPSELRRAVATNATNDAERRHRIATLLGGYTIRRLNDIDLEIREDTLEVSFATIFATAIFIELSINRTEATEQIRMDIGEIIASILIARLQAGRAVNRPEFVYAGCALRSYAWLNPHRDLLTQSQFFLSQLLELDRSNDTDVVWFATFAGGYPSTTGKITLWDLRNDGLLSDSYICADSPLSLNALSLSGSDWETLRNDLRAISRGCPPVESLATKAMNLCQKRSSVASPQLLAWMFLRSWDEDHRFRASILLNEEQSRIGDPFSMLSFGDAYSEELLEEQSVNLRSNLSGWCVRKRIKLTETDIEKVATRILEVVKNLACDREGFPFVMLDFES